MSVHELPDERARLAASVRVRSARIVRASFERLAPAERTVGAKVLATRFVDVCADSASSGDLRAIARWSDDACARYGSVLPAQRVIAATLDEVSAAFRAADELTARAFERARRAVAAELAKARTTDAATNVEAIDEIDVVLDGLLVKLDQADVLTAEHSRAVASWCARLAKQLGGSKADVLHLTRAGLIHDIGKVTTPASILTAPRALTDDEFAVMKQHSAEGEKIVLEVPLIANLAPAVRSHHERFDGKGYPDGLRGEDIPHVARIVAVADCFNAMIGRRPYRPPLAPSIALERLVEGRGGQFDPDIVDAMVEVLTARA